MLKTIRVMFNSPTQFEEYVMIKSYTGETIRVCGEDMPVPTTIVECYWNDIINGEESVYSKLKEFAGLNILELSFDGDTMKNPRIMAAFVTNFMKYNISYSISYTTMDSIYLG